MRSVFSILLLSFCVAAQAQNNLPPAFEITVDTISSQAIRGQYVQLLTDKKGTWTIEQVRTPPLTNQFAPTPANFNYYAEHTHWQRLRLHNATAKEAKVGFFNYQQRVDYYVKHSDERWEHFQSGWSVPWSKGDGFKKTTFSFIPIVLKPDETAIVYRRIYNSYRIPYFNRAVGIGSTDKIVQDSYINDDAEFIAAIRNAFNFGFCLFAALFSLFFFFIVRERVYLYFSIYVAVIGLGRFSDELFVLFFKEHPVFWSFLYPFLIYRITPFFLVQFIRHLLKTYQYVPRLDTFLYLLSFLPIATGLCALLFPPTSQVMWEVEEGLRTADLTVVVLTALITFFLVLKKQRWTNKLLTFAIFPAFVIWGVLFTIYRLYIDIPQGIFGRQPDAFGQWLSYWWWSVETLCLGWQIVFFSWLLLQRFGAQRRQIAQLALEKERERSQLIEQQRQELEQQVTTRTAELQHSLQELKAAQAQLIQSEKMASLGELTAGIAHEIQNPLNFVNNFSETNTELLEDAETEFRSGNQAEGFALLADIKQNEAKINYHGKRADAIVKNMLQHSRTSAGEKQFTDINALVDEYLRLAYHGFRAKDKSFDVTIQTYFDDSISKVNIVPQEIGRVLLNLFNNAFYATHEQLKKLGEGYEPKVWVSTKKINDRIEIAVRDNGMGISKSVQDKIFQPFFTTKPTGEGTGLGLSLSYDIIKAHGGELSVESIEGKGAAFIVSLMTQHNT